MISNTSDDIPEIPFIEKHMGTDMLASAWILLASCIICDGILGYYLILAFKSDAFIIINVCCGLVSSLIYTVGAYIFLVASYDDSYSEAVIASKVVSCNDMSCTQRYFTGNNLLIMCWYLFIGTLPLFYTPISAYDANLISLQDFLFYISFLTFIVSILFLWIIACLPENMLKNDGRGSSYVEDSLVYLFGCYCFRRRSLPPRKDALSDFLLVSWVIAIASLFTVIASIVLIILKPEEVTAYFWLVSSVLFCLGSLLFLYASYPQNARSRFFWRTLCCDGSVKTLPEEERDSLLRAYSS